MYYQMDSTYILCFSFSLLGIKYATKIKFKSKLIFILQTNYQILKHSIYKNINKHSTTLVTWGMLNIKKHDKIKTNEDKCIRNFYIPETQLSPCRPSPFQ